MARSKKSKMGLCLAICSILAGFPAIGAFADQKSFDGLDMTMGNLPLLSNAKTRSIGPENPTGEKGKGGMAKLGVGSASNAAADLGQGWKVNPYVRIAPNQTFVLADINGSGAIQHIWMTPAGSDRLNILKIYWDGEETPSVECPLGDFFACGLGEYAQVTSVAVCVNPKSGFNCYWSMPFRKGCKMTVTNMDKSQMTLYFQIDYCLTEVAETAAYFHAQFRRVNPVPFKEVYTLVDGIVGRGHYVGTYMTWGANSPGWWGEGEIKFYMDGDTEFPTICGTGTEDYFCGSYGFDNPKGGGYMIFSGPYAGMPQVINPKGQPVKKTKVFEDGKFIEERTTFNPKDQPRFSLYRWHIMDPIRFEQNLKVTMQALGWQAGGKYLPLQDDISSVAFWYQAEPHAPFPKLPDREQLKITK
jgi:hypothetical protein